MRIAGEDMMRRRKALAEHPFGTLKCRAGYRHFLVRGFAKVRGEWSLMALCYNFSRVLTSSASTGGWRCWRCVPAIRAACCFSPLSACLAGSAGWRPRFAEPSKPSKSRHGALLLHHSARFLAQPLRFSALRCF
jgi:hypothetical protein